MTAVAPIAIRAEGLAKKYVIGHQAGDAAYGALRDVIADAARGVVLRAAGFVRGKPAATPRSEDLWALRDVSFDVRQGEAIGVIGRNGAGKSTLLKVLSRITEPSAGRVTISGRVASLLEVGTGFHPELTGRENVFLNGAILGMTRQEIRAKFDEIVTFAEVERFLDTPVKRYSSGMYVRLAFAVAAHLEPEILLVDEVLAVGDMEFRRKCLGKMQGVSEQGRTVLFVSHDMGNIVNLCARTIWMDAGTVRAVGPTKDVISEYVTSGAHLLGEVVWPDKQKAPGNENVRLQAVRIRSGEKVGADVMIDQPISIEIDYWNLREQSKLITNIHLRDSTNGFVFASVNWPSASLEPDPWVHRERPLGLFRSVCVIPANFLNSEQYSIDVGVQTHSLDWQVWEKNTLTFVVHETGEMKKEYMGSWVGVVRPKLSWFTTIVETSTIHAPAEPARPNL
jgi:lipopolysaccharide transport system ATP-binding protein